MTKPKILVTSAAGQGFQRVCAFFELQATAVMELLANGYRVPAFVRRRDARAV